MRARELVLEYDRSRTLGMLPDREILNRLTPHDWRELAVHWDGQQEVSYRDLETYCQKAVGRLRVDMSRDNFEDDAISYAEPSLEYAGYWKWVKDFIIDLCEQADPSRKKSFVPTILSWFHKGRGMSYLEDIYKAHGALQTYMKFRNRFTGMNLKEMDFHTFADKMDEAAQIPSGSEEDKLEQQRLFDNGDAYLTLDNERVRVVVPHTKEGAIYFGRNTRWCTSAKQNNQFARYNRESPLYIVLFKKENVRWQWHFNSEQFMDEKDVDNQEDIHKTLPDYPELMELWDSNYRRELQYFSEGTGRHGRTYALESQMIRCIKMMFEPTLEDWKLVLNPARNPTPALKGETWNLIPPTRNKELMELVQQHWMERHHRDA